MITIGVILGSGLGGRFGASFPKQFMSLNGKMVIQHSIDNMVESKMFDYIICTVPSDLKFDNYSKKLKNIDKIIVGGKTRTETIINVLNSCPQNGQYIVFHDAVRPFTKPYHFVSGLNILQTPGLDYLVTGQRITDALISSTEKNISGENRNNYWLCQTPEFFRLSSLQKRKNDLTKNLNDYTYIAQTFAGQIEFAYKGSILEYKDNNLKITYERDLFNAEQLMKYTEIDERGSVNIKNKRILLFGGSGDIGKATKKYLEDMGAKVVSPTREECNLADSKTIPIYNKKFDCVICSAGTYTTDEEDLEKAYDQIMSVNFQSIISIIKHSENYWLTKGGNIIILGSTCAGYGRKGISLYSASKSALNSFVEGYHHKLKQKNININIIAPAKVQGRLQKNINPLADQEQMIKLDRLAEIISHYVTTDKTGEVVYIRYGLENKQ